MRTMKMPSRAFKGAKHPHAELRIYTCINFALRAWHSPAFKWYLHANNINNTSDNHITPTPLAQPQARFKANGTRGHCA